MLNLRLVQPTILVDITAIPELTRVEEDAGGVTVGACVTSADIEDERVRLEELSILKAVAAGVAYRAVRNRGTIGGSIAHADPAADYPTVLKAVGATINVIGKGGERSIAADDFFTGLFETALEPGEIVTSVTVPATTGAAYEKHAHPASRYAVVGVAAVVGVEGGTCKSARITIGGATASPVHATAAAESLIGGPGSSEAIAAAAEKVPEAITSAIGDAYASGEYRQHLAKVLARRALTKAFERAG
jgi:carbon-monoxide dehydrogenase medium subunit